MIWDMSLMDKCPICNMNISVYDKFCINCGTKLSIKNVANNKKRFQLPQWRFERSNKECFYILIVSMMIAFIISFVISLIPVNITIVGVWADDKGETVSFNKESYFEMNIHYGKYTIRDEKLLMDFEDSDYLGYNSSDKTVYIPNKEIADEFVVSMKATGLWKKTIETVLQSRQLLADTLQGNADVVAQAIEKVHDSNSSILNYNNEQSLRFIILIAYYYAKEQYEIIQEMPSGKGFADIVFIPKHNVDAEKYPPMVVELKWDDTAKTAIKQIKDRNYPDKLKSFEKILLVGISYEKDIEKNKKHKCIIEEYKVQ